MDRFVPRINQVLGNTCQIEHANILHVDPRALVECRKDFLEFDRTRLRMFAVAIRGTDGLADLHSTARQDGRVRLWPVVPAVASVDFRSAAEFAPDDHRDISIQSPFVQVRDERREALIEQRTFFATLRVIHPVRPVPVPAALVERHKSCAGFDQPAGNAQIFDHRGSAIPLKFLAAFSITSHNPRILFRQIQCIDQL